MVEYLKKNAGAAGIAIIIRIAEALLIAGIIGGVLTWGYTQTVKVEIDGIKSSIGEVKMDVRDLKSANVVVAGELAVHKAATLSSGGNLSVDVVREMLQDIRRDIKRDREKGKQ